MNVIPLGPAVAGVLCAFLLAVVLVAFFWPGRGRKEGAGRDPRAGLEPGGRSLSLPVLAGTLFATLYLGDSCLGFAGNGARDGYLALFGPLAMQVVFVGYLLYAPRLFSLSRERGYRTPGDFILDRFGNRLLHLLASLIMICVLLGVVAAQLAGIGSVTLILTDGYAHPAWGIAVFGVLMAACGNAGGMRTSARVNVLQGVFLLAGVLSLLGFIELRMGGLGPALERMSELWPEKARTPDAARTIGWVSGMLVLVIAASVYPHTIQRIFAARSGSVLKGALAIAAFLTLVTTLPLVLIGVKAQALAGAAAPLGDFAVPSLLRHVLFSPAGTLIAALFMTGAIAAMMGAADSALLTASSLLSRDLAETHILRGRPSRFYLGLGRIATWVIVLGAGIAATASLKAGRTAWQHLEIMMELLIQLAPLIWIGARTRRPGGGAALAGVCAGEAFTIAIRLLLHGRILGFHAGLWGLALNLAILMPAVGFRRRNRA